MLRFILSKTALQGPAGSSVVRTKSTEPAKISADPGVYIAPTEELSSKDPSPDVVQSADVAPFPTAPLSVYEALSQIVSSTPALAVGVAETIINPDIVTAAVPLLFVVLNDTE
jgi:hypothetical protein